MKLNDEPPEFDLTLTALAHPVRRAILERVMQTELRVTELAEPFAMSLNAVSKHIRVLEQAGLVNRRRVWRNTSYRSIRNRSSRCRRGSKSRVLSGPPGSTHSTSS